MSYSSFLDQKILDKVWRGVDFTVSNRYVSLHTADPGKTGVSEVTGSPYARQLCNNWDAVDVIAGKQRTRNTNAVLFTVPAGTFTYFGVWDALSGGNLLGAGMLASAVTLALNDLLVLPAQSLSVIQEL